MGTKKTPGKVAGYGLQGFLRGALHRAWAAVLLGTFVVVVGSSATANEPPEVSNVVAVQREGTRVVDVSYDVYDADGDPLTVSLRLSEDGGQSYAIGCVTVSGDVGSGVLSGTGKQIEWDAGADYPEQVGDAYVVKVIAAEMFVQVPAGVFIMGDGEAYCGEDEHEVTLTRDFYLGQHEVTNQEYLEALQWAYEQGHVTVTTSSVHDNLDGCTQELLDLDDSDCEIQFDGAGSFYLRESPDSHAQDAYPGGYDPSDHPVKEVTWYGSVRYCDWLSLQAGLTRAYAHSGDWSCNGGDPYGAEGYRLPTDAEWEYAAQFDDERIYPWGDEGPDCSRANYHGGDPYCVGWTTPVGSYADAPVALGLSDMAGNVREWCNDWSECNLGTSPQTDPVGPSGGSGRVLRGGSWFYNVHYLRCASRGPSNPYYSFYTLGFRAARANHP